ncbi:MAG: hypothetical protein ACREJM_01670, partial [Candidatus Saccharimonadales bacterium]
RMNDSTAPGAPALPAGAIAQTSLGTDRLTEYLNPSSEVMFNPEPSPDFLMAAGDPSRITLCPATNTDANGASS